MGIGFWVCFTMCFVLRVKSSFCNLLKASWSKVKSSWNDIYYWVGCFDGMSVLWFGDERCHCVFVKMLFDLFVFQIIASWNKPLLIWLPICNNIGSIGCGVLKKVTISEAACLRKLLMLTLGIGIVWGLKTSVSIIISFLWLNWSISCNYSGMAQHKMQLFLSNPRMISVMVSYGWLL